MLPSVLSREVKVGIRRFLESTFPSSTPLFQHTLGDLLDKPGEVFKGPYYSMRLPFKAADSDHTPFQNVQYPYRPHWHQARAFERLCGETPQSTIVATGTGSGKTECFLYPILEHCAQRAATKGIKAIILYPMNALATDQAKRFAKAAHQNLPADSPVKVGMYVGGTGDDATTMTPDWVITDRKTMRENPPDILLTNYKMLDYLLIRPDDIDLWADNQPDTLKFIVVDELHTFDGAQATDLACLIRRLKARLKTPEQHLCCVGTSATIGSLEQGDDLLAYASTLFGEPIGSKEAIIGERLLSHPEFTSGCYIKHASIPGVESSNALRPGHYEGQADYLRGQYQLWFQRSAPEKLNDPDWRIRLGLELREHTLFRNLLQFFEDKALSPEGTKQIPESDLLQELALFSPDLQDRELAFKVFDSLCSLAGHARYEHPETKAVFPLLKIHVHLWFRELSRMVATVEPRDTLSEDEEATSLRRGPRLHFSSELKEEESSRALPVIHCRECGSMGWGALQRSNENKLRGELDKFYQGFFANDPKLRLVFPEDSNGNGEFHQQLCGHCLHLNEGKFERCPTCGQEDRLIPVQVFFKSFKRKDRLVADRSCPHCQSKTGITILGSRSASLSSVALGQSFATRFNSDKQTLAFSDNVQDASHRAAFFSARTYRTTLRTAFCEALQSQDGEQSLEEFERYCLGYWKEKLDRKAFVGAFLAPNMEWLEDYEGLRRHGKLDADSSLPDLVSKRLAWELIAEFGFQSRIGRTLEKSGAAIAFVPLDRVIPAAQSLAKSLKETQGGFGSIKDESLTSFLIGLIHRLRTIGGIHHGPMTGYFADHGNTYLLNRENWTPSFSTQARCPAAFTMGSTQPKNLERVVATGTTPSWLQVWAIKSIQIPGGLTKETATEVIEQALKALTQHGILLQSDSRHGNQNWLLDKASVLVSTSVAQMNCDSCGHQISVHQGEETTQWTQTHCLRRDCQGHYQERPQGLDYFGELYRNGDVTRIHAEEHTGMIDRNEREWIEQRFLGVGERRTTDPNLLSCTPTLEMGIDIGDLSTVLLCSVPPETANYLQRTGRAGRRDGNAFSLTVANAQPHDLYYYRLPEEMMDGTVDVPGVFLSAPAVLERQFLAFCFDRWIATTLPRPSIPHKVGPVLQAVLSETRQEATFPFNLLSFIQSQRALLLNDFCELFDESLDDDAQASIAEYVQGEADQQGSLEYKILDQLTTYAKEREDLRKRRIDIRNRLRKLEAMKAKDEDTDQQIEDLGRNAKALSGIIRTLGDIVTFQFFTDEGLLPNYAFPEEGVTLRSVILRKKQRKSSESEGNYTTETLEYQRPAASAIRELAPGSSFYAQHRRLTVDQVNLRLSEPELWNFCDQCAYIERIDTGKEEHATCPTCGSAGWADTSMRRKMIPMRQVMTTEFDRSSRTQDESDERTPEFFDSTQSVAIPDSEIQRAYQVKDSAVPFGFEFVRQATLRSINLGSENVAGEQIQLGGTQRLAQGFRLCPECGKVKGVRREFTHDISCRHRDRNQSDEELEAFFLYRELTSEALRVLVPSVGGQETDEITSFIAGLQLGLEIHFNGNIEHLGSCLETRPIPDSSFRRTYLVIFDKVPGGTGYLKQLSHSAEELLSVLRKALEHLRACSCASEPENDGCHRCVLKNRRRQGSKADPSRSTAIQILEHILSRNSEIEEIKSIAKIDINPLIESQLEQRFLETLFGHTEIKRREELIDGKNAYLITVGSQSWQLLPQVTFGEEHGLPLNTRADFVLRPVRGKSQGVRPIAIYLDGFAFHADESRGNNRIAKDLQQRAALRNIGYDAWSLTWDDLGKKESSTKHFTHPGLEDAQINQCTTLLGAISGELGARFKPLASSSSWDLLVAYLKDPEIDSWRRYAYCIALAISNPRPMVSNSIEDQLRETLEPYRQAKPVLVDTPHSPQVAVYHQSKPTRWTLLGATSMSALKERDPSELRMVVRFSDHEGLEKSELIRDWNGLLRLRNLLQYLPNVYFVSDRGLRDGLFNHVADQWGQTKTEAPSEEKKTNANWQFDPDLIHEFVVPLLEALQTTEIPEPECGFELAGSDGTILGEAEIAWPEAKFALLLEDQTTLAPFLSTQGWKHHPFTGDIPATLEIINQALS